MLNSSPRTQALLLTSTSRKDTRVLAHRTSLPLVIVTSSPSKAAISGPGGHRFPVSTGTAPLVASPSVRVNQEDAPLVTVVESQSVIAISILTTRCVISAHVPPLPALPVAAHSQQAKGMRRSFVPDCVPCHLAAGVSQDSGVTSSPAVARRITTKTQPCHPTPAA
jgi:hypothetical protein